MSGYRNPHYARDYARKRRREAGIPEKVRRDKAYWRKYQTEWAERKRRAEGVLPWSEHPKKVKPPRPPKRTPEEARAAARERYARNRLSLIAYQKAWAKANPDKVRVSRTLGRRERLARIRATQREHVSYRRILERDVCFCGICGGILDTGILRNVHFDHIVPLSKGGAHVESNIQISHPTCNMRKHTSLPP